MRTRQRRSMIAPIERYRETGDASVIMLAEVESGAWLQVGIRFVHIFAAFVAGGAIVFQARALRPSLATLNDEQRRTLGTQIADRWRPLVLTLVGLLLITGLLNFVLYQVPAYKDHASKGVYHGLFGLKFLAALILFHGITVLSLPGAKGERYRANAAGRLSFLTLLLIVIVACATVMRYFPTLFPAAATT